MKFYLGRNSSTMTWENGAIGHRPGGPMDCIGPYAKVENCPIDGTNIRVTAYASGYPDTFFSVPARCSYKGKYIGGYFLMGDEGPVFVAYHRFANRLSAR